jgi:hypothetical protein
MKKMVSLLLFLLVGLINAQELELNLLGGFYKNAIKVDVKSNQKVYYSLDGTVPSILYSEPLYIDSTKLLRYAVSKADSLIEFSPELYLINAYHSLPVVSIQTEPNNLFDRDTGIFMMGPKASSKKPFKGANFWSNKEVLAHLEYFENGKSQLKQNIGIRVFGGYSRSNDQKSITLVSRKKYGKKKMNHKFFKTRKFSSYKTLILRNSGNDFNKSMLRDAYYTTVCRNIGVDVQASQPTVVYINGSYWGIMNLREKLNENYLKQHHDINKDSLDLLKHRYDRQHGSNKDYRALLKWLETADLSTKEDSLYFVKRVDIENFMNYNIAEVFCDNRDAGGNIRYYRDGKDGKWRWILFDVDAGLNNGANKGYKSNTLKKMTTYSDEAWPNPAWSTFIIRKILENPNWKKKYIQLFHYHLNTTFNPQRTIKILDSMEANINHEMVYHKMRWGGSLASYQREINSIKSFMSKRPEYCMNHLGKLFGLGEAQYFYTDFENDHIKILVKDIPLSACDQLISFKDLVKDIKVIPEQGHQIRKVEWTNNVLFVETEKKKQYKRALYITGINPNNEEIELTNYSKKAINLQYYQIADAKNAHITRLPNCVIKPNESVLLSGIDTLGGRIKIPFKLSKKGDKVRLFSSQMLLLEELEVSSKESFLLAQNTSKKASELKSNKPSSNEKTGKNYFPIYFTFLTICALSVFLYNRIR